MFERSLGELNAADLIIALLSRAYFASHFCLAEAGAALARKAAGACEFFSVVIPLANFSDLDGMLHGVQSGSITDRPSLGELRDRILQKTNVNPPPSSIWDQKREYFIKEALCVSTLYESKEDLGKIIISEYRWCREDGPKVTVHSKLRVSLRNGSKDGKNLLDKSHAILAG